jgi:hypothetical protein
MKRVIAQVDAGEHEERFEKMLQTTMRASEQAYSVTLATH